jgi:hypothetical protein
MSSLWKDLLFLHGHLLHEQDLQWHADIAPAQEATRTTMPAPESAPAKHPRDCGTAACA